VLGWGFVLAGWLWPVAAAAQPSAPLPPPRLEIWGGLAFPLPVTGGTLDVSYSPPLFLGGSPLESRAAQTLTADSRLGEGIDLGLNVFFTRALGVQASFAWSRAPLVGANAPYNVHLRYVSTPPPDYAPREVSVDRTDPWDDTSGTLRRRSVAVGGVLRWRAHGARLGGTVAGGLSLDRYSGEIQSLAYTQFVLGGHSTLFSTRHRAVMALSQPGQVFSPYVGGDIHVRMSPRTALFSGLRVACGSDFVVPTRFERLVDPDEDTWTPADADAAARLGAQPLTVRGIRWQAMAGLKVFVR
jgi:hypothetical protein